MRIPSHVLFSIVSIVPALAVVATSSPVRADSCPNTCVTMAVPRTDGVHTRLDGTADAILWPPTRELRTIRLSALNQRGAACDVTIRDVRQDELPRVSASGTTIYDASSCDNDGETSTIQLRSDRDEDGDGRAYRIDVGLADPDCEAAERADEVLIAVPIRPTTESLESYDDHPTIAASYAGPALQCEPWQDDRLASRRSRPD